MRYRFEMSQSRLPLFTKVTMWRSSSVTRMRPSGIPKTPTSSAMNTPPEALEQTLTTLLQKSQNSLAFTNVAIWKLSYGTCKPSSSPTGIHIYICPSKTPPVSNGPHNYPRWAFVTCFHCPFVPSPHVVGIPNPRLGPSTNAHKAWKSMSTISRFCIISRLKGTSNFQASWTLHFYLLFVIAVTNYRPLTSFFVVLEYSHLLFVTCLCYLLLVTAYLCHLLVAYPLLLIFCYLPFVDLTYPLLLILCHLLTYLLTYLLTCCLSLVT